jgi:signal transduction histidine kinase/DNA-binding response OmpR family regulator
MTRKVSTDKILIVDDEERMCQSLSRLLSDLGYQTKAVVEPAVAIKEMETDSYDLVLTDIKMPGLDGFDLLKAAKKKDKDSVVVFMTGYGSLDSAVRAISLGAYDYLLKPLEMEDLKLTIQRGLEKRRADVEKSKLLDELKGINAALQKKVQELDALYQASKSISTTVELSKLLPTILQLATQVIGAKIGSIMLSDENKKELRIEAAIGLDLEIVQKTVLKLGDSIAGYVAEKGTPLIVEDVESDPRFKRINKAKYETRSLLSAPLKVQNKVIGVINLNNKLDGTPFTQEDLRLLTTFAAQAAVAIDDTYHYNQVKNKAGELSVLYEVASGLSTLEDFEEIARFIYIKLKNVVPLDYALWLGWDEKEELLELRHTEGMLQKFKLGQIELSFGKEEVFQLDKFKSKLEKKLSENTPREFKPGTLEAVPILAEGALHGVLCVGSSAGQTITQSQKEIVSIVASQAASVYERQKALLNATRLITMGNLVSEISHDLKKPLTNIKSSLQILREKKSAEQNREELLSSAEEEVMRLAELVKELVNFSKPESYQPERKPMAAILDKAVKLIETDLSNKKIELIKQYNSDLPSLLVNEKTILEVFLNILINALESMPEGGSLTVSARIELEEEREKRFLKISIADSGCGMSKETLDRIFERYFTTKEGGSGLGLAVVDRVIKAHNGFIKVESKSGKGTIFQVFLPLN